MESSSSSSSSSANSSFVSTRSSTSPHLHGDGDDHSGGHNNNSTTTDDVPAIKQEQTGDAPPCSADGYEPSVWAHIFDENGIVCLDDDGDANDDPMDVDDVAADPRRFVTGGIAAREASVGSNTVAAAAMMASGGNRRPTMDHNAESSSSHGDLFYRPAGLFDTWSCYEEGLQSTSPYQQPHQPLQDAAAAAMTTGIAAAHLLPPLAGFSHMMSNPAMGAAAPQPHVAFGFATSAVPAASDPHHELDPSASGSIAYPSHFLPLERLSDGQPFPLCKPILRDDGLLLVGTDLAPNSAALASGRDCNRIFVVDFRSFHPSQPVPFLRTQGDVRDLQWLDGTTAVAAIGHNIHLVCPTGRGTDDDDDGDDMDDDTPTNGKSAEAVGRSLCGGLAYRLLPAMRSIHADTIREIAISNRTSPRGAHSTTIASGGFDETVVLTTLGESGDPASATLTAKVDAYDAVSSLRWHPVDAAQLSWTTDGGDFQVADVRARTKPQLQVPLSAYLDIDLMGGLFTHEYISGSNVVLGFQSGHLLFLDLRMPRKEYCYGKMKAPLDTIGELRRSVDGTCAAFGLGGFATASVGLSGRELENMAGAKPSHGALNGFHQYKTSGDFSCDSGSTLAVSDNLGVVSIYNGNGLSGSTVTAALTAASGSEQNWHKRL